MKYTICDNEVVKSVLEHMNEDHHDACLVITQALGNCDDAVHSTIVGMDASGVDFSAALQNGQTQKIRVEFSKPITRDSQIRGHLVALTKRARAILEE
ncbi:MAG: DUF2470 domain-containing protein [Granulosicoccus sp.]